MKNISIILSALLLIQLSSCDKEDVVINNGPLFLNEIRAEGTLPDSGEEKVMEITPGVKKVPLDASLFIEFSKPANTSTLTGVKVMRGTSEIPTTNSVEGNTLIINPNADFEEGVKYELVISDELRAADGGLFFPTRNIVFSAIGGQFDDQVLYFAFENSMIDSVTEQSATPTNTTFETGVKGQGLGFDVANEAYAVFNSNASLQNMSSFTVSLWVNPTFVDADENGTVDGTLGLFTLSKLNGFWGNIDVFITNGSNSENAVYRAMTTNVSSQNWIRIPDLGNIWGKWTHHLYTYDPELGEFRFYLDGVERFSINPDLTGGLTFENVGPLVMGCNAFMTDPSYSSTGKQGWASYFTGTLDEIRVFNVTLTDQQITDLYNSEKP